MGLSSYNIKKWLKMLTGKSIMHVNQDLGKYFSPGELKGYFNDLTEKVLRDPETLKAKTIPMSSDEKAGKVYFPIAIFQYGIGAYDLYIGTREEIYKDQFMRCVDWAIKNQEEIGAWNNFGFVQAEAPYSSMCQGEGCSLLLRAYKETGNVIYLTAATKAIDFMLLPIEKGGTAEFLNEEIILHEYTNKPAILNGWIFSFFGLYELSLILKDKRYKELVEISICSLKNHLNEFDLGYWSKYDMGKMISSPFYHKLHIAQLKALVMIFGDLAFSEILVKFEKYQRSWWNRKRAFIKKAWQKIKE
jgi:D-glucuronyl C5-epimerase C-terminus